jgi:hypothetical protein
MMHASTLDADIINMIIICSRAAWPTSAPPSIAPVIIPGMEIMPITLGSAISELEARVSAMP